MRRLFLTFVILAVSSGCALRPRYRDFISETTPGPDAKFVLHEKDSPTVLPGVKLEMSEWKNKLYVTTDAEGAFALPVEKKYLDENPVLVVTLPVGVTGYEIAPVSAAVVAPEPTRMPEVPTTVDVPASSASPVPNK